MTRRARVWLFIAAALALATVLVHGLAGLPAFGHFHGVDGLTLSRVTVAQRHATDVITAINFDYRGLDTMGEEFILFSASVGLVVLLREQRGESEEKAETDGSRRSGSSGRSEPDDRAGDPAPDPLPAIVGRWSIAPLLVLGVYIVTHGQLTPGGGFQGGVVLAAGVITLSVAGGGVSMRPLPGRSAMEVMEALGSGGYVAIGLAGLIAGLRFLANFLPLGTTGSLLSSGTITSLSTIVGLEVAGGIALIVAEFAEQGRLRRATR